MSEDLNKKIHNIIEKYKNPATNKYFSSEDPSINIVHNNGHLNISIEIEPSNFNKKYLETKRDKMGHEILKK